MILCCYTSSINKDDYYFYILLHLEDARILSPYPDCSGTPVLTSCPGEDEEYKKRTHSRMLKVKLIPTDENTVDDEKCL